MKLNMPQQSPSSQPSSNLEAKPKNIHLLLRLMAIFYDALLLVAVVFFAALAVSPLLYLAGMMDMSKVDQIHPLVELPFQLYLLAVCYFYFAWPWMRSGQTLGLSTWRVKLVSANEEPLTHKRLLIRFAVSIVSWACLGLGFLWSLFDSQRLTWHDKASKTQLVKVPPKPRKK